MKWGFFLLTSYPLLIFSQHLFFNVCGSITCSFSGVIADEKGTPLEWAIVLLKEKNRVVSACRTDSLGNYQLSGRVKHLHKATLAFAYLWVEEVKIVYQEAETVNMVLNCEYIDDYGIPIYTPVGENQYIESIDQIWDFNRRITD